MRISQFGTGVAGRVGLTTPEGRSPADHLHQCGDPSHHPDAGIAAAAASRRWSAWTAEPGHAGGLHHRAEPRWARFGEALPGRPRAQARVPARGLTGATSIPRARL